MNRPEAKQEEICDRREGAEPMVADYRQSSDRNSIERITKHLSDLRKRESDHQLQFEELKHNYLRLQSDHEKYLDLYDRAPVGFATLNERDVMTDANETLCSMLSAQPNSLTGRTFESIVLHTDQETHKEHQRYLLEPGDRQVYEVRLKRDTDDIFWASVQCIRMINNNSREETVRVSISDISEQKKTEEKQNYSYELLNEAQTIGRIGSFLYDPTQRLITGSNAFYKLFGLPEANERVYIDAFLDLLIPEDRSKVEESIAESIEGDNPDLEVEFRVSADNGTDRIINIHGRAHFSTKGEVINIIGTAQDLTENKRLERRINYLSRFPAEDPNPVLRIQADGILRYANEAARPFIKAKRMRVDKSVPRRWQKRVTNALECKKPIYCEAELGKDTYSFCIAPIIEQNYANLYGTLITEQKEVHKREKRSSMISAASQSALNTMEAMREGVALLDLDGTIRSVNAALTDLAGCSKEEIEGENVSDLLHLWVGHERTEESMAALQSASEGKIPNIGTITIKSMIGKRISIRPRISFIYDDSGAPVSIVAILQNVSDIVAANRAIIENEERLAEAQRIAHIGNWDWNIKRNTMTCSEEIPRIYGIDPKKFGRSYEAFMSSVHTDDRNRLITALNKSLYEDEPFDIDHRIVRPDGSERIVHERAEIIFDREGKATRMYGTIQDITELRENEFNLTTLNALLRLFTTTASRQEYAESVAELIRSVSGCRCVRIKMINDGDESHTMETMPSGKLFMAMMSQCVCSRIINDDKKPEKGNCMLPADSSSSGNSAAFAEQTGNKETSPARTSCIEENFDSVVVLPIRHRGRTLGGLHLADHSKIKTSPKLMALIESITPLVGEAFHKFNMEEMMRSLSSELSLAEEKERKRLASALHDSVGQTLALTKLKLGSLGRFLEDDTATTELSEIRAIFDKSIQQLRSLTFELSPPILYELGLDAALEWLGEQFEQEHRTKFFFESDGNIKRVNETSSVLIFQSARELLNNIGKHAKAQQVKVSISFDEKNLNLLIHDDGEGFDIDSLRKRSYEQNSFGLFSIRQRMRHIGGTMWIDSNPGEGTTVVLSAPSDFRAHKDTEN